jgi:hypothetical protein
MNDWWYMYAKTAITIWESAREIVIFLLNCTGEAHVSNHREVHSAWHDQNVLLPGGEEGVDTLHAD